MDPRVQVAWKTAVWLTVNGAAQALPISYLWLRRDVNDKAFWEYVNCTLALLIAVGMLFAAISDVITEKGRVTLLGWGAIVVIVVMAVSALHRVLHDEFLRAMKADWELFCGSLVVGLAVIAVGTFLKMKMWYDEAAKDV